MFRSASDAADDRAMTKGPDKRDVRFSMRLPAALHERLRKAAEVDRRTMADYVIILLERELNASR